MTKIGDKVWFEEFSGNRRPAIVTGKGEKNGELIFDVQVEDATDKFDRNRWGYADQITAR